MAILIPGSDVTLAPAIRALVRPSGGSVRQAVNQLVASGFVAAQLDATLTGLRPRDLDDRVLTCSGQQSGHPYSGHVDVRP